MNKYTVSLENEIGTKINIIFKDPKALECSNRGYVQGEAVDRLAAYEALGKTPEELAAIISGNQKTTKKNPKESEFNFEEAQNFLHIFCYKGKENTTIELNGTGEDLLAIVTMVIKNLAHDNPLMVIMLTESIRCAIISEEN